MADGAQWRTDGVRVVRAESVRNGMTGPARSGRVTAFNFTGSGGNATWVGAVTLAPHAKTGAHHHGRHEVAVYVAKGRSEIRWGERLEYAAEVGPGDLVYFAPFVPHQEFNLDAGANLEFLVVRSDNAGIVVNLDVVPLDRPETLY